MVTRSGCSYVARLPYYQLRSEVERMGRVDVQLTRLVVG